MRPWTRRALAHEGLLTSIDVRSSAGLDMTSPLDVYALCDTLHVAARFVGINMEGLYVKGIRPRILISALRPLPRRTFTCGHELGHHVFGHGFTIDEITDESSAGTTFKPEEFLVQTFAGYLLMPTVGVRKAFAIRGWTPAAATPTQLYAIACSFGVGYATLINHLAYALEMIPQSRARALLKLTPARLRQEILGVASSLPLIVADQHWLLPTLDTEVGTQLLLPADAQVENDLLAWRADLMGVRLFDTIKPGITHVQCPDTGWAASVRASRYQYVGLSQYRHLEEDEEGDDD